ncbi:MAG: hypothetical protein KGH66_03340 [Candidatus Micrarchaeota archaeon]|nr:hypothetical protein [Candidatus Micrarchaeota archaeon]
MRIRRNSLREWERPCMPIKYNLTTHDILAGSIHKLAINGSTVERLAEQDAVLRAKAIIIASFASAHSWKTYKAITSGIVLLNKPEIREEYLAAKNAKWKSVRNIDIQEVSSMDLRDGHFSSWLFSNVDKPEHATYRAAWGSLRKDFLNGCDVINAKA